MAKTPYVFKSLPIKDIDYGSLFKSAIRASNAIAKYDGLLNGLVNPAVLMSPLSIQEAQYSSRIEDIYVTVEDVLTQEAGGNIINKDREEILNIQDVINYRQALIYAQNSLASGQPISLYFIRSIHQILMQGARGNTKSPGEFRKDQNWIGPKGCSVEDADFIPVAPEHLEAALTDLVNYIDYDDTDKIAQAAIIHAQCELIHPFRDGNGRVGRLLIPLFLSYKKMLSVPMFYISGYLERNRNQYIKRLSSLSKNNDWEQWIDFFYQAVIEQSIVNSKKVEQLRQLYDDCKTLVRDVTGSKYSDAITDGLFQGQIFSRPQLATLTKIPNATLYKQIDKLENANVIRIYLQGSGTIPTTYYYPKLLSATSEMQMEEKQISSS